MLYNHYAWVYGYCREKVFCLFVFNCRCQRLHLLLGELAQIKSHFHWDQNSSLIASVVILIFLLTGILHNCCEAYNVRLLEAKIFSGPSAEQFGYAVQQFVNDQGKW